MQPDLRTPTDRSSVWIVEDNANFRTTVQELIDGEADLTCPRTFGSGEALLEYLNHHFAPEVMIVDLGLPGMSGIDVIRRVTRFSPATRLVVLTIHEDNDRIFEAICAGASGYLLKSARGDQILGSIRDVLQGGAPLTPQIARRVLNLFTQLKAPRWDYGLTERERDVLGELVAGKTKRQIGKALFLSSHTVDTHLRNIYAKLHVHTRSQAVVIAVNERLVTGEDEGNGHS